MAKVINRRIVWEGRFLRTVLLTYRDRHGQTRNWEAVERINCSGIVVIVPVTPTGDLLFVRQYRPVVGAHVIEFPAGLNDRHEDLLEAAHRELIEETGHTSDRLVFLARGPVSSGLSTEIITAFLARDAVPARPCLLEQYPPEESEDIEIVRIPLSRVSTELAKLEAKGDLVDLKVYGLTSLVRETHNIVTPPREGLGGVTTLG